MLNELRIVYVNDEDVLSVIVPAPSSSLSIEEIASKDVPKGKPFLILHKDAIPKDRTYRKAWEFDGGNIGINLPKAKEIHKEYLRQDREERFKKVDVDFLLALEQEDTVAKQKAIKEKNRLRNITKKVDAVNTLEDLKKINIDTE